METNLSIMYQKHWQDCHKAVCSIIFYGKTGSKLLGVTGFRVGNRVVTDDLIYSLQDAIQVKIRFYEEDGNKVFKEIILSYNEFQAILPERSDFENMGFAYFSLPQEILAGTTSLELCNKCNSVIGKEAFTISYQYDQNGLAMKSALVSSNFFNDRGLSYIQFDGTVRPGTSGSPLIDFDEGKVIGIVANKELHIVKTYREILKNVDNNLSILEKVKGKWFIEDVDPIQVLIVNQNQIKHLSKEFFSNFAVKAGYALEVNHLREQLENYSDSDIELDQEPLAD